MPCHVLAGKARELTAFFRGENDGASGTAAGAADTAVGTAGVPARGRLATKASRVCIAGLLKSYQGAFDP